MSSESKISRIGIAISSLPYSEIVALAGIMEEARSYDSKTGKCLKRSMRQISPDLLAVMAEQMEGYGNG